MRRRDAGRIIRHALLGLWSIVCLFPLYWLAITSFKPASEIDQGPRYLPFVDFTPTLESWRYILTGSDNMMTSVLNSALVASVSSALAIFAGAAATYALSRFEYRLPWAPRHALNRVLMLAILATRLLAPVALALPLYMMASAAGLLDTDLALILAYAAVNLPVALWLLLPALGERPSEQEDAARLDGASHLLLFFGIVLPMAARSLAAAGLLVFVLCWNEYLFASYLATDRAMTAPVWLVGQLSVKESQTASDAEESARFSAAAVLLVVPLLGFAGLVQRAVSRGALETGKRER